MGLFRRKKDAEGFYTGDAPASAPGLDGAAPSAYQGSDLVDYSRHIEGADSTLTSEPGGAQTFGAEAFGAQTSGAQTFSGQSAPAVGTSTQQVVIGRRSRSGCFFGLFTTIVLLAVLIPVGFAVYHAVKSADSALSNADAVTSNDGLGGRSLGQTTLGESVPVSFDSATFEATVFGATAQPRNGWSHSYSGSGPILVVEAQLTRTDAGTEPVDVLGWNWSVVGSDSKRVTGDIISHYEPSMDGLKLVGGQTVRGFVTFTTGVTATSLTLAGAPFGAGLATWNIAAAKPSVVAGAAGVPAQAEISRPPFAVTISTPRSIEGSDPLAQQIPGSQQFLLLDAEFTPNEGTAGSLGLIERESFVFVPDGAPAMYSTFGAVADALSILSLDGSRTDSAVLAFDTNATSGSLELRDGADQAVLAWPIDLG